jgi:hypothetical protein
VILLLLILALCALWFFIKALLFCVLCLAVLAAGIGIIAAAAWTYDRVETRYKNRRKL